MCVCVYIYIYIWQISHLIFFLGLSQLLAQTLWIHWLNEWTDLENMWRPGMSPSPRANDQGCRPQCQPPPPTPALPVPVRTYTKLSPWAWGQTSLLLSREGLLGESRYPPTTPPIPENYLFPSPLPRASLLFPSSSLPIASELVSITLCSSHFTQVQTVLHSLWCFLLANRQLTYKSPSVMTSHTERESVSLKNR